ncbi:unnamed protein product, partial [Polarella glacialis]
MIRDLAKLVLANASQIRLVKAAALRTFLFPSDNACIQAAKQAGSEYSQTAKLRGGSATLSPPHLMCFAAILRTLVADTSVPEQLKVTARAAIASPDTLHFFVCACKVSKCFDKNKTRLEVAVRP